MKLELKNLGKKYGKDNWAVDHVNLTLNNGVYALIGANGSGKTTLMRMIADVLFPTEGKILLDGEDIHTLDEDYRALLGYLPQNFGYYKDFSVKDFLLYMAALKGLDANFAKMRAADIAEQVNITEFYNQKMKTLSGGMRQRVGIAQALLNDPEILILDEPTSGIDPKERIRFRNLLAELAGERLVIYATHIVSDVSFLANNVLLMKDGVFKVNGTMEEALDTCRGKVWSATLDAVSAEALHKAYNVTAMNREGDNVAMKILADSAPCTDAVPADPTLDDLYLYYFDKEDEE